MPDDSKTKIKACIGSLLIGADQLTKAVISAYEHEKSHEHNKAALSNGKFKVESLERCAAHLNLSITNDQDEKLYKNKAQLADILILKIESHFEQVCDECNQTYAHALEADPQPRVRCFLCLQGAHNCQAMSDRLDKLDAVAKDDRPTGLIWICRGCRLNNTSPLLNANTVPISHAHADDEAIPADPPDDPDQDLPAPEICPLFVKNKCPHGLSGKKEVNGKTCDKTHPKRCNRYCRSGTHKKYGCTKKKDECELYHPKLCRDSVSGRACLNEDCTFTHLKGTKRHAEPEQKNPPAAADATLKPPAKVTRADIPAANTTKPTVKATEPAADATEPPANRAFLEQLIGNLMDGFDKRFKEIEQRLTTPHIPSFPQPAALQQPWHLSQRPAYIPHQWIPMADTQSGARPLFC